MARFSDTAESIRGHGAVLIRYTFNLQDIPSDVLAAEL